MNKLILTSQVGAGGGFGSLPFDDPAGEHYVIERDGKVVANDLAERYSRAIGQ